MDLVVIYGPPATGKLTVARELERLTGAKIFDNHSTLDLVGRLFPFGSGTFNEIVVSIRKQMIEGAAKHGIDLIFTSIWKNANYESAQDLVRLVERYSGKVHFVYLTASMEELLRRVEDDSRKSFGKIKDRRELGDYLRTHRVLAEAPIPGSLTIDNTRIQPKEVAELIVNRFGLCTTSKGKSTK